jgi:DNA-binding NtrC family response regulator
MSGSATILHVEDDEFVTRSLRRWLERRGFSVTSTATCGEARSTESRFAIGVFDIDLPDGDGIGLAAEMLGRGTVKSAVFYTATADAGALARASQIGPVVTKGDDLHHLLQALPKAGSQSNYTVAPESGVEGPPSPKASTA